jgi:hypothetical protein
MTSYDPDGRFHQPDADLGELRDPVEQGYGAPSRSPLAFYDAGLVAHDRPGLATGYTLFRPAARVVVTSLYVHVLASWVAAGAANLTIGTPSEPDALVTSRNLVGLAAPSTFQSDWTLVTIGPGDPLLVTVTGSPTAGLLAVRFIGGGMVVPSFDPATLSYVERS